MEATTIQVEKDVYDRLVEEKETDRDSFNSVLRRVLEMDEPSDAPPKNVKANHFTVKFMTDEFEHNLTNNGSFLKALELTSEEMTDMCAGSLSTTKTLNGVEARVQIKAALEIKIEAKSDPELLEKIKKIQPLLEPVVGKFGLGKNVEIDAWYCYNKKELEDMGFGKKE